MPAAGHGHGHGRGAEILIGCTLNRTELNGSEPKRIHRNLASALRCFLANPLPSLLPPSRCQVQSLAELSQPRNAQAEAADEATAMLVHSVATLEICTIFEREG